MISVDFIEKPVVKPLPENHKKRNKAAEAVSNTTSTLMMYGIRAAELSLYVFVLFNCGLLACFITVVILTFVKVLGIAWLFKLLLVPSKK
jgi:hypothetical protein